MQAPTDAIQEDQALPTKLRWLLVGLTAVTYWRVSFHGFINYDDGSFVFSNPHIYTGLSLANLTWAFGTLNGDATSYQPLVWLSHQLDCQLFGLQAGVHHLTNLWFHIANAVLLFTLLDSVTGRPWRSGLVALLFALHPLHVETVAWVSERKSLVCTFFWLLTTLSYVRYVRRGGVARYLLVLLLCAAALLSKPVAVGLPFALLLIDFWPLRRLRWQAIGAFEAAEDDTRLPVKGKGVGTLLAEKIPLFLLSGLFCCVTIAAQTDMGAVRSLDEVPMRVRLSNCPVAYVLYLRKVFCPSDLAPIYPLRHDWAWWQVAGSAVLLVGISIWAVRQVRTRPHLFVGWHWYVVTLLPTIGLIQVGSQGLADRYTYVPLIGVFFLIVWELSERFSAIRVGAVVSWVSASAIIVGCAVCTSLTVRYWQDSRSLFEHAIRVTGRNYVAYRQLAMAYQNAGKLGKAENFYRESLRIDNTKAPTHMFFGVLLFEEGRYREAFDEYSSALKLKPTDSQTHAKLAELFWRSKEARFHDPAEALNEARVACKLTHHRKREPLVLLAEICVQNGRFDEASNSAQAAFLLSACPQDVQEAKQILSDINRIQASNTNGIALQ